MSGGAHERMSALFTDFYELTMAQGYRKHNMNCPAVFDMFFRRQPFGGGFSVFAGIETLIDELTSFSFSEADIAYLDSTGVFEKDFLDYLTTFRFSGDLYAMKEGSVIFPGEPLVRIHANLIEAQIIEGLILNTKRFRYGIRFAPRPRGRRSDERFARGLHRRCVEHEQYPRRYALRHSRFGNDGAFVDYVVSERT